MLTINVQDRITIDQLLNHPWLNEGFVPLQPVKTEQEPLNERVLTLLARAGLSMGLSGVFDIALCVCDNVCGLFVAHACGSVNALMSIAVY